jgi:hypothetical protein
MKIFYFIPLLFLSACSTAPRLALQPQQPPPKIDNDAVRYPEIIRAYHIGRYVDPSDSLVMHEQHVVYRVEENARWDLRPLRAATIGNDAVFFPVSAPRNAAFSPTPVNDAVLAEVNAQRLATAQITMQARTLSVALMQFQIALQQTKTNFQQTAELRATVSAMQKRLDALEAAQSMQFNSSATNEPSFDPLSAQ